MKMAQNQMSRMSTPRASGSDVDAVCATMRSPAKPAAAVARALRRQQLTDHARALNRVRPCGARRRTGRGAHRATMSQAHTRVTARAIFAWLSAALPPARRSAPALLRALSACAYALICAARVRRLCAPMRRTQLGGADNALHSCTGKQKTLAHLRFLPASPPWASVRHGRHRTCRWDSRSSSTQTWFTPTRGGAGVALQAAAGCFSIISSKSPAASESPVTTATWRTRPAMGAATCAQAAA